ncbi:hypothetical protein [Chryseolinea lacunae]|uniref:Addiction module protein n=1 Tax=Chryseolinea lacunae TaxID=2801331 RepID=A0ABS1KYH4_9BACT|nr:hypothetical protein [Chryseolinea lacunae]MBL0744498.1 hypothetical protein [Chryseolinea lacunae]
MKTEEIRQKLVDYIQVADEKKVHALYTMVENEIQMEAPDIWTDEFLAELNNRFDEAEKGDAKVYSWEEVVARAKQFAKDR